MYYLSNKRSSVIWVMWLNSMQQIYSDGKNLYERAFPIDILNIS